MRVDFSVPLRGGKVVSDQRLVAALPSVKHLVKAGAKIVLMTHLGRPAGTGFQPEYSVRPVADRLSELLGIPVALGPQSVVGEDLDRVIASLKSGDVLLMENLRFHSGETMPDRAEDSADGTLTARQQEVLDSFVRAIAKHGAVFVNDAFAASHRRHASIYGVARAVQAKGGPAVAGFLVEKEVKYLGAVLAEPRRPFIAILGGAKVEDKLKLISRLLPKVDRLLIGGAMAYTLLKAKGVSVGRSRVDIACKAEMTQLLTRSADKIVLPSDHIATDRFDPQNLDAGDPVSIPAASIPDRLMGVDIGSQTVAAYADIIAGASTILWNGPVGVSEIATFAHGTEALAAAIADATERGAVSVIGGGDTAPAVERTGYAGKMSHVSTGGGACLEFLQGETLPGIEVLDSM